eukprot:13414927-Alexandrium_andersonii.AAC.1
MRRQNDPSDEVAVPANGPNGGVGAPAFGQWQAPATASHNPASETMKRQNDPSDEVAVRNGPA